MKKIIFLFCMLFVVIEYSNAQTYKFYTTQNIHNILKLNTKTGEIYQIQDDGQMWEISSHITEYNSVVNRYELYETKNMWNFILIDKCSGLIWQVQYSTSDNRLIVPINDTYLSTTSSIKYYPIPLTSMYQFYLINGETGEYYKFQWSTNGSDYRWIEKM